MESRPGITKAGKPATEACWKTIGVMGDGTCPELATAVHCRNCPVFAEAGQRLFERDPPAQYIDQQTALLSEQVAAEATDCRALILFRVGDQWLALDADVTVEVAQLRPAHRVPYRKDRLLLGIVNIRGQLQLCVSLRRLLGIAGDDALPEFPLPRTAGHATGQSVLERSRGRLLVVQKAGRWWALAVDEVAGVHHVSVDRMGDVPTTVGKSVRRLTRAVFSQDDMHVGCLDADRFFETLQRSIG